MMKRLSHPHSIRLLHWGVAVLITVALISGYRVSDAGWSGVGLIDRPELFELHVSAGLLICVFSIVWSGLRCFKFRENSRQKNWFEVSVAISHIALLGLGAAIGFLGWAGHSAGNGNLVLFDLVPVPQITPELGAESSVLFFDLHRMLVPWFLALLAVHVAAVLYHALVKRDDVLRSMLFANRTN
ncbi:MAG: cytochrome b/b6 domain-containing protein [Pseudomonadota bacterium]